MIFCLGFFKAMRGKNRANTSVFESILTKQGRKKLPKNEFWILMDLLSKKGILI